MAGEPPCYLYGVIRSDDAPRIPDLQGVSGVPVTALLAGPLAALMSELENTALRASRADLLTHADVLQRVAEDCDVVPVRFGHIYVRRDQLRRDLLEGREAELIRVLDGIRGTVEIQVKATYVEELVVADLVRSDRRLQRLRGGPLDHGRQLELGRRLASLLESRRQRDAARLVGRLAPFAEHTSLGDPPGELGVVAAALLVRRSALDDLLEELDRVDVEEPAMTVRTLGPTAPYSFVAGDLQGVA